MSIKEMLQECNTQPGANILIFLENEAQVLDCIEWIDDIKNAKRIIALSPFAVYELDNQKMPYKLIEDYYDPGELYKLGIGNYQTVETLCDLLDKKIQNIINISNNNITPAFFGLHKLKMIYDAVTIRSFQLYQLIDAEKPDNMIIYGNKNRPYEEISPDLLFDNTESIYAYLLALRGWRIKVSVLPPLQHPESSYDSKVAHKNIRFNVKKDLVRWLEHYPYMFDFAMAARKRGLNGLSGTLKGYLHTKKQAHVLLIGSGYNWDDCIVELSLNGIAPLSRIQDDTIHHWIDGQYFNKMDISSMAVAWEELKVDEDIRGFFRCGNIDLFSVVEGRLRFLMEYWTIACLNAYETIKELISKKKIRAVLSSTMSTCTDHAIAQAAKDLNVPVILWQHGTYGYFNWPGGIYNDIMSSDVLFVFGEGTAEKIKTSARQYNTKILPVGSATIEKISQNYSLSRSKSCVKLNPTKKVILYVMTNFYQNNLYISWSPPFSDNHLWETQRSLIDTFNKYDEYNVIIKIHPSHIYRESPIRRYVMRKGCADYHFIRDECFFIDLLPLADIIVMDAPSTVLLQSLTTTKPIFALTRHMNIDDDALVLLKRRVYCYSDLDEFTNTLDMFLSYGIINSKVDLNNKDFLERYGIPSQDGTIGERAAKELKRITDKFKQKIARMD